MTQNENPDTSNKRSTYIRSNKKWGVPQEETRQYIMEEYHKSVEEIEEYYDGFKLILRNFDFDTASSYDIQERVEVLGKYIHELDIYYNGELIEEKDLTEGDGSKYQFSVDDENCKGWIALGNNYSWGNNVNVFYKGRLVAPLEGLPYLKGDLHVSDKTLNLTSPDRKDIIKDEKLNVFKKVITEHVKKYCTSLLVNGEENISDYASCFGYYVNTALYNFFTINHTYI